MIKGDIDGDGLVTMHDLYLLECAIAGTFNLNNGARWAADMNNNGFVNINDLFALNELLEKRIPGDANGDGVIDAKDVEVMKKEIEGCLKLDPKCFANADINKDGRVTVRDVTTLKKMIDGIIAGYKLNLPRRNRVVIQLNEFEKGEYLSWFVTTQAAFEVNVTLRDDKKVYFSGKKRTTDIAPPLAVGNAEYIGKNLVLEIYIPQSANIRPLPAMNTIITDTGKTVGHSFTCCGEDWTDNDFNDFYINVVGWKSKR